MQSIFQKRFKRLRRKRRVRGRVFGTAERPRLSVFRSNKQIYAQIIDDSTGRTLCAMSSRSKTLQESLGSGGNKTAATEVGKALADVAKQKGIQSVVFDRSGYRYHGRVRALADAVRQSGVKV
ncbi:MAG: 50S ribosomal protein L18 [Phycisphaerae bacterium]